MKIELNEITIKKIVEGYQDNNEEGAGLRNDLNWQWRGSSSNREYKVPLRYTQITFATLRQLLILSERYIQFCG